jgi:mRNA-degrading endonuclease RelE of RelBE toxin-antitoxin system
MQYRVIYQIEKDIVTVYVIDIAPRDYKGVAKGARNLSHPE